MHTPQGKRISLLLKRLENQKTLQRRQKRGKTSLNGNGPEAGNQISIKRGKKAKPGLQNNKSSSCISIEVCCYKVNCNEGNKQKSESSF